VKDNGARKRARKNLCDCSRRRRIAELTSCFWTAWIFNIYRHKCATRGWFERVYWFESGLTEKCTSRWHLRRAPDQSALRWSRTNGNEIAIGLKIVDCHGREWAQKTIEVHESNPVFVCGTRETQAGEIPTRLTNCQNCKWHGRTFPEISNSTVCYDTQFFHPGLRWWVDVSQYIFAHLEDVHESVRGRIDLMRNRNEHLADRRQQRLLENSILAQRLNPSQRPRFVPHFSNNFRWCYLAHFGRWGKGFEKRSHSIRWLYHWSSPPR